MRPHDPSLIIRAPRGPFPRPNLTMRELIGLVLAFAISNAFLSWTNPHAAAHPVLFAIWNGILSGYLGFVFLQAYVRSILRWIRTGHAEPERRRPQRWTALGVAEATVIGGTMLWCIALLPLVATRDIVRIDDWTAPLVILALGTGAGIIVLRMWRTSPGASSAARRIEMIETGRELEHRETR